MLPKGQGQLLPRLNSCLHSSSILPPNGLENRCFAAACQIGARPYPPGAPGQVLASLLPTDPQDPNRVWRGHLHHSNNCTAGGLWEEQDLAPCIKAPLGKLPGRSPSGRCSGPQVTTANRAENRQNEHNNHTTHCQETVLGGPEGRA